MMKLDDVFIRENLMLLFEPAVYDGEFIANVNSCYTTYAPKDFYDYKWSINFSSGRYVIVVFQRHSVYHNGNQIYLNEAFENVTGKYSRYKKPSFVIAMETPREYSVPTWGDHKLVSDIMHSDNSPLQPRIFTLDEAIKRATELSKTGDKMCVLEWYEDFDMY
ncbi:hypothetical protein SAMN02910369_00938 [Lachnospiraceae bacterium NE2001]|nr:hypothetical protein SAMN02910369_00938 [Lachnospiraceae bacterium NE2001]